MQFHLYADDCQVYIPIKSNGSFQSLLDCLSDIRGCWQWVSCLFIKTKIEVIFYKSSGSSYFPSFDFSSVPPYKKTQPQSGLSIKWVKSCFFFLQLRWLSHIKPILSRRYLKTVLHKFIAWIIVTLILLESTGLLSHTYSWSKMLIPFIKYCQTWAHQSDFGLPSLASHSVSNPFWDCFICF